MKPRTKIISVLLSLIMLLSVFTVISVQFSANDSDIDDACADQYVYKLVDSLTAGHDYLIVNKNTTGSAYALKNDGGSSSGTSLNRASVTVKSADVDKDGNADLYITSPSISTIWTATTNAEGVALTNADEFLEGKSGNIKIFTEQQYPERYWHYTDQQLIFENPAEGDRAVDYTLYYSSSNFTHATSSNSNKIYIYQKTAVDEIPVEIETEAPTAAPITANFKLTDTMKAGGEYLIVNTDSVGSAYALKNEGGSDDGTSLARESVTVESADLNSDNVADTYIATATTDLVWLATANEEGFKLTNNGDYLEGKGGNIKIFDAVQYAYRYWTYEDSQLRIEGASTIYTLYYSSNNFTSSTSSNTGKLYIYEKVAVDQIPTQDPSTQEPTTPPVTHDPTQPPTKIFILGDADGDGEVSVIDVTFIQRYDTMFDIPIPFETLINGDVDDTGDLEIIDATYIQRWLAGLIVPLAIGEQIYIY